MGKEVDSPGDRATDELELHAWLERAEFKHPSLSDPAVRGEATALARMRDELKLQLALGKLEAREEWERLEQRWRSFKHAASLAAHEVKETLHDVLRDIRDGYQRLRDMLQP